MPIRRLFDGLFGKSASDAPEQRLASYVLDGARDPEPYAKGGVPDTLDGRWSVAVIYLWAVSRSLRERGEDGAALAQATFDEVLERVELSLREAAVGDIAIPKRLAKLTRIFHGHTRAFDAALLADDPAEALGSSIARNLADTAEPDSAMLGRYGVAVWAAVSGTPTDELLDGRVREAVEETT